MAGNKTLSDRLRFASMALRTALHAKSNPAAEKLLDKIEDYMKNVPDTIADTRVWRWFRELRKEYKVTRIPQIKEYLAKRGLNPQDNAIPIFRDFDKLQLVLENDETVVETLAPDRNRIREAREVIEFIRRLAGDTKSPLRDVVEKLNHLGFRGEAEKVQRFIRDAQGISDTLSRVVIGG